MLLNDKENNKYNDKLIVIIRINIKYMLTIKLIINF